jgi:tRNA G18 (ribose-2'-O)-methylase SpoU
VPDTSLVPYRDVGNPAALERKGLFVAEGRLTVERLLYEGRFEVESVVVSPAAAQALAPVLARHPDIPVHRCDRSELERVTGFDFHRGCLALAKRPTVSMALERFAAASRLLVLEGVGNPDNVGGLFRVALAFGAGGVLLDRSSADPLYRKAIRTSMAASLRVPFARVEPWPSGLDALKARGFTLVALTPDPDAMSIEVFSPEPNTRLILALGSEGPGLTSELLRYADVRLRIPIDPKADSLNVVVAAGIAMASLRAGAPTPDGQMPASSSR